MEKKTLLEIALQEDGSVSASSTTTNINEIIVVLNAIHSIGNKLIEELEKLLGIKSEDSKLFHEIKSKLEAKKFSSPEELKQALKDFKAILDGR